MLESYIKNTQQELFLKRLFVCVIYVSRAYLGVNYSITDLICP